MSTMSPFGSGPWLQELFAAIDAKNTARFLEFLEDDAQFRFGNLPPCQGKQAIGAAVTAFFGSIRSCRHDVAASWAIGDGIVCHGQVAYTRHDGRQVGVPFANILIRRGQRIGDYLIFADVSPLYADPEKAAGNKGK